MRRTSPLLGALIGAALAIPCFSGEKPSAGQVEWLRQHAVVFDSDQPGNGLADLQGFKRLVGDARIVALGEATHGTREFFRMKHRLTEMLATEMGFTIFSIEASMPEAYRLNDYVLGAEGDPAALIGGMYFWTWNTQEVLDMVRWMRRFNQSGRGRIEFTGFDMQFPEVAAANVLGPLSKAAPELRTRLAPVFEQAAEPLRSDSGPFSVVTDVFPLDAALGRKLRYSGYVKTDGVEGGAAGLFWVVHGKDGARLVLEDMSDRGGPSGSTDWTRYEIELEIPRDAHRIAYGVKLSGRGKAWFDSLKIELDGVDQKRNGFDLGFEDGSLGVFARGAALDKTTSHSGGQSLLMERDASTQERLDGLVRDTRQAVELLESSKDRLAAGLGDDEAEWVIQNARIVHQFILNRKGGPGRVRERAMAENVRWILQRNPKARIVLWAHNGHVWRRPQAMGSYLAEWYGDKYLPVAFTTAQGRYYAMPAFGDKDRSKRVHDLKAPVQGSFESFLQAAKRPRFAIDLRLARPGDSQSGWLTQKRFFRSIGALASELQFYMVDLVREFDVVIYFEMTHPALQLPQRPASPD